MENINLIKEFENRETKINVNKKKEKSFDKLCKIQKLLKKESALKELCKL